MYRNLRNSLEGNSANQRLSSVSKNLLASLRIVEPLQYQNMLLEVLMLLIPYLKTTGSS
jgi:hypothetical protein